VAALVARVATAQSYPQWIASHTITGAAGGAPTPLLIITEFPDDSSSDGTIVGADGAISSFRRSNMGGMGGGGGSLSPDALENLQTLLAALPDDKSRVPPNNRALLLQATVGGHTVTRVYDRANAPDLVWKIVRAAQSGISPWVQEFPPQSEIDVFGSEPGGDFSLSPDGKQMLFGLCNGANYEVWDTAAHEFLADIPGNLQANYDSSSAFSPKGDLVVVCDAGGQVPCVETKTWTVVHKLSQRTDYGREERLSFPQFTPDGRNLLIVSNNTSLECFDTTTWQNIALPTGVPEDALRYFPSSQPDRAVVMTREGELELWNPATQQKIATLRTNIEVESVAFSPDGALVATAANTPREANSPDPHTQLEIWTTDTGKPAQRTAPTSVAHYFGIRQLAWSPDSNYVLAATKPDDFYSSYTVTIINAKTGRPRGSLAGSATTIAGMGLLPNGQVVAGCEDGKIRFWDLPAALHQIHSLESSLPAN
jgi:WD40 repeat protein